MVSNGQVSAACGLHNASHTCIVVHHTNSAFAVMQLDKAAALELAKQSPDQHEGDWSLHSIAGAVPVTQWHY